MNFDNIWVEKYRPKSLDDIVLPVDTRKIIESYKAKKEISNLLLISSPGQGKTTLAKMIVNNILECDYLYVNASDENGIDTIRTKVISFAQTRSLTGDIKVIILDECLHEDTLVTVLRDGTEQQIKIKDVDEYNDLVKSFNFIKNRLEYRPFYKIDKGIQDVYEIEFENGQVICCTGDHKWYVFCKKTNTRTRKKLIDIIEEGIDEIINVS
jgi:hypothetical protein